jgi:hypothetical protein
MPCHCHAEGKRNGKSKRSGLTTPKPFSALPKPERTVVSEKVSSLFSCDFCARVLSGAPGGLRKRILTIEVVMMSLLQFVVGATGSFLELVDRLRCGSIPGLREVEVSPQAFYRRLRALPHTLFVDLLQETTRQLRHSEHPVRQWVKELAPFANGIYAMDDTTLDALARKSKLLQQYPKGAMETLGGRLGCILDLVTGKYAEILYDPDSAANEKNHARPLIERLGQGAVYVFDLGYFAFPFLDYLTEGKNWFVTRMRAKTSFKVIQVMAESTHYRDRIVWLGKYAADRAAHPVRLVELQINGEWWGYLTNVLDPQCLDAAAVWALYNQRWNIEKSFATVKRALDMAFLRVTHENGILIQIWTTLTVYQVLQDLRLELAATIGCRDDDISWLNLMRRISWYAEKPATVPLREWLNKKAQKLYLEKRGIRKRRLDELPSDVTSQCLPPPPPPNLDGLKPRTPRQGDTSRARRPRPLFIAALS